MVAALCMLRCNARLKACMRVWIGDSFFLYFSVQWPFIALEKKKRESWITLRHVQKKSNLERSDVALSSSSANVRLEF